MMERGRKKYKKSKDFFFHPCLAHRIYFIYANIEDWTRLITPFIQTELCVYIHLYSCVYL